MSTSTLDQVLFGQRGVVSKLSEYIDGRGKVKEPELDKTHQLNVSFRQPGDASYMEILKKPVKPGFSPMVVAELVRDAIEEELGPNPRGEVRVTFYPSKGSGNPPVRVFRECASVALNADPEVDFLMRRLAVVESELREKRTLDASIILGQQQMVGKVVEEIRKLAVTRATASSISDAGGGVVGLIALGVGLPMLKRTLGLRTDATMEEVSDRFGMAAEAQIKKYQKDGMEASPAEGGAGWDEVDQADQTAKEKDSEPEQLSGPVEGQEAAPKELEADEELQDHHIVMLLRMAETMGDPAKKAELTQRVMMVAASHNITVPDAIVKMALS